MKTKHEAKAGVAGGQPAPQTGAGVSPTQEGSGKTKRVVRERPAAVVAAEEALAKAKAEAKAERAKTVKPKAEPRPTCTSTKHDGTPCTAKAKAGQETCVDHTPAWERLTDDEKLGWEVFVDDQQHYDWANRLGWHAVKAILAAEEGK